MNGYEHVLEDALGFEYECDEYDFEYSYDEEKEHEYEHGSYIKSDYGCIRLCLQKEYSEIP